MAIRFVGMNLQTIIDDIAAAIAKDAAQIEAAADAKDEAADPGPFGIAIATADGVLTAGAADIAFPIQSISKVLALELALQRLDDRLFERVGREPSGDPFNSVIDLERTEGVPRNPFINAGALVVVDMLVDGAAGRRRRRRLRPLAAGGPRVSLDDEVLSRGGATSTGRCSLHEAPSQSAIADGPASWMRMSSSARFSVDCAGLAMAGRFLARTRIDLTDEAAAQARRRMRTVLALMMTCGHYDGSGDFAVRVGLPAKSGVGGGILAIAPEQCIDRRVVAEPRSAREFDPGRPRVGDAGSADGLVGVRTSDRLAPSIRRRDKPRVPGAQSTSRGRCPSSAMRAGRNRRAVAAVRQGMIIIAQRTLIVGEFTA